jgi:hypothetical protein
MPDSVLQQIEADIAETERLMTELRLRIAVNQSAGEDTTDRERRLQDMLKGWMLLQDQRQKAAQQITSKSLTGTGPTTSTDGLIRLFIGTGSGSRPAVGQSPCGNSRRRT